MTVELPKDAEGREIPPDTALLYGKVPGEEHEVACFNFRPGMRQWRVELNTWRRPYPRRSDGRNQAEAMSVPRLHRPAYSHLPNIWQR